MDPLAIGELVTLVNAISAGVALIIHAWRNTASDRVLKKAPTSLPVAIVPAPTPTPAETTVPTPTTPMVP
jgi:hypothetical protein